MLALSSQEFEIIDSLVEFGVFDKIEGNRLDRSNGIILICCSDGDQFHDLYTHKCRFQQEQRGDQNPRIHPFDCNGGVLAYDKGTPVNRFESTYMEKLLAIGDAIAMKGHVPVVMEGHGPCGAANLHSIAFINQLEIQMRVKRVMKQMYPHEDITSYFHVDYRGHNGMSKKSWHFGLDPWVEWHATIAPKFRTAA